MKKNTQLLLQERPSAIGKGGADEIEKHSACEICGGLKVSQNIILISIDRKTRLEIIMYEEMA